MLYETYYNIYKGWGKNPFLHNGVPEIVMRNCNHLLSPSYELIDEYKSKEITWDRFVIKYKEEMNNEKSKLEMLRIKKLAKDKDVYLICTCYNKDNKCHRFILLELINGMKEK